MSKAEPNPVRERRMTSFRGQENRLDIKVPEHHVLRLVARSFLALILICSAGFSVNPSCVFSTASAMAASSGEHDNIAFFSNLFYDLNLKGLVHAGDRSLFLGCHSSAIGHVIQQNKMDLAGICAGKIGSCGILQSFPDGTLDFVLSMNGIPDIEFIDRKLKIGGMAVIRLSSNRVVPYRVISNFRFVYIRKFHLTMIAVRKEFDRSREVASPFLSNEEAQQ